MPTSYVDAYMGQYVEMPDRLEPMRHWTPSRYGFRSYNPAPADGGQGSCLQGVWYRVTPRSLGFGFGFPAGEPEGPYLKAQSASFKDTGVPRGAHILDAHLEGPLLSGGSDPNPGFLFGVLGENPLSRYMSWYGYNATDQTQHFPVFGFQRRFRTDSRPLMHGRHTEAKAYFAPGSTEVPPITEVIQEIVNQPFWEPADRIIIGVSMDPGPTEVVHIPGGGAGVSCESGVLALSITYE